jgi:methionyl-tRNA synthetase
MPSLPASPTSEDTNILAASDALLDQVRIHIDQQSFHEALRCIWDVIAAANRYVDNQAPWGLKKTDPERMKEVLAVLAEIIRQVAILTQPFMPQSAAKILDQLGVDEHARGFDIIAGQGRLANGHLIEKPEPVFPRYIDEEPA